MADVKWIKVSTSMFESNRKIKQIETMPEGDTILVIWLKLLLLAGSINDRGAIYITPEFPYNEEMLATELRRPIKTVRMALSLFESFGMIEIIDNVYYLSAWEKYQSTDKLEEIRKRDRERKRAKKAREHALLPEGDANSAEIPRNIRGASDGVPSIEEEREKEKEEEKEFHSFVHSGATANSIFTKDRYDEYRMKYLGGELGQGVVMMSDAQFGDLCDKLSIEELDKYLGIIVQCEMSGKSFTKKTHYQAILDMVAKDRKVAAI